MGSICSGARSDDVPEKTSVALDRKYKSVNLQDISGDICNQNVEAIGINHIDGFNAILITIVNPSNNVLSHRSGFSNYLIRKGGEIIQEQSDRYFQTISEEFLPPAAIVITSAGKLQAKYIIHVVSPLWTGGDHDEEKNLSRGISNVLSKADEMGISSLAFPDLSGGIFGFPKELCAEVLTRTVIEYINKHPATNLRMIKFVAIENTMVKLIKTEIQKWVVLDSLPNLRNKKSINADLEEEEEGQQNEAAPLLFHKEKNVRSLLKTPSFGSRTAETTNDQYIEEKLRLNNARQI